MDKKQSPKRERTQSAQPTLQSIPSKKHVNESVQTGALPPRSRKRLAWSSDGGRSTSSSDRSVSLVYQAVYDDTFYELFVCNIYGTLEFTSHAFMTCELLPVDYCFDRCLLQLY